MAHSLAKNDVQQSEASSDDTPSIPTRVSFLIEAPAVGLTIEYHLLSLAQHDLARTPFVPVRFRTCFVAVNTMSESTPAGRYPMTRLLTTCQLITRHWGLCDIRLRFCRQEWHRSHLCVTPFGELPSSLVSNSGEIDGMPHVHHATPSGQGRLWLRLRSHPHTGQPKVLPGQTTSRAALQVLIDACMHAMLPSKLRCFQRCRASVFLRCPTYNSCTFTGGCEV